MMKKKVWGSYQPTSYLSQSSKSGAFQPPAGKRHWHCVNSLHGFLQKKEGVRITTSWHCQRWSKINYMIWPFPAPFNNVRILCAPIVKTSPPPHWNIKTKTPASPGRLFNSPPQFCNLCPVPDQVLHDVLLDNPRTPDWTQQVHFDVLSVHELLQDIRHRVFKVLHKPEYVTWCGCSENLKLFKLVDHLFTSSSFLL